MVPRLYVPALTTASDRLTVPADEAEHAARVLRLKPGADVRLFDGRGLEREARVTRVARHEMDVEVGQDVAAAAECRVRVSLAQAVLKGDKIDDVIRDAVMMGVAEIRPLITARADVPAAAFRQGGRVDRWRRVAVSSVKQCGRAVVPEVLEPMTLSACLAADRSDVRVLLAEPSAGSGGGVDALRRLPAVSSALVLIGPEGGWSAAEVAEAVEAGSVPITLGRRTLRADAAALIALTLLLHAWGDLVS